MSIEPAIDIQGISKRYRLGVCHAMHGGLGDRVRAMAGRMRAMMRGGGGEERRPKDFWALSGIDLCVRGGEVVGLIGSNGAGKSTLLKILSRITDPTHGHATVRGRLGSLLEVGTGFHPELSGRENIYLNGAVLGMSRREISARFDQIVEFSGISNFLETPIKRYSSGMTVRLAFAVAAHLDPEIMLIDEVLAVGDASFQQRCLGKMRNLVNAEGRTIVFVSHNMDAVATLCDRVIHIDQGRIVAQGDPHAVITSYLACHGRKSSALYVDESPFENGDTRPRLIQAQLTDLNGEAITDLRFGEPFGIDMNWFFPVAYPGAVIRLRFFDQNERELFTTESPVSTPEIDSEVARTPWPSKVNVHCQVPNNVMIPGDYRLHVESLQRPTVLTSISHCLKLSITEIPYQHHHRFKHRGSSLIAVPTRWNYRQAA